MHTDLDIAWLAGLFEGEGTIYCRVERPTFLRITIAMTDEDIIQRVAAMFPFGSVRDYVQGGRNNKRMYAWYFTGEGNFLAFYDAVQSYLGIRRRTAFADAWSKWIADRMERNLLVLRESL